MIPNPAVSTTYALLRAHGERLRALVGMKLVATWMAWNRRDERWFADEAVVLVFSGAQLEVVCLRLDQIVLTWGEIDPRQTPSWVADWSESDLEWRKDAHPAARAVVGRIVTAINAVEHLLPHEERWMLHGIELELGPRRLLVFNAQEDAQEGGEYRRLAL